MCLWQRFDCSSIVIFGNVLIAHQLLSFSQLHDPWSINKQWAAAVKKAAIVLALPIFLFDKKNIITPLPHFMTFLIIERFTKKGQQLWLLPNVRCLNSDVWRQIAEIMNHLISDVWSLQFWSLITANHAQRASCSFWSLWLLSVLCCSLSARSLKVQV